MGKRSLLTDLAWNLFKEIVRHLFDTTAAHQLGKIPSTYYLLLTSIHRQCSSRRSVPAASRRCWRTTASSTTSSTFRRRKFRSELFGRSGKMIRCAISCWAFSSAAGCQDHRTTRNSIFWLRTFPIHISERSDVV